MPPETFQIGKETSPMISQKETLRRGRVLLPLRVLYTLSASPQYLLARQRHKVEVFPLLREGDNHTTPGAKEPGIITANQLYAKVPLKTCLGAVCNASPELVCDRLRDYSVYVVDPLESPPSDDNALNAPIQESCGNTPSGSRGECVSIGMGLMSWCLAGNRAPSGCDDDEEGEYVVGKFVKDRGADALEVMMSLRETATQTQHQHALSLSSWGLLMPPTIPINSSVLPSIPQLSSPFPNLGPPPTPASSTPLKALKKPESEALPEAKEGIFSQDCLPSAAGHTSASSRPVDRPTRTKTKKIGRPPGAKTHPEKRARQVAIQMHKEKLERLQNILKMQNGEEYDKTLIIASECETKVTEDIIARERRLLEELQSRPLIIDGPRYTTEPLPRRASSPNIPLLAGTTAPKRKTKSATPTNAIASGSGSTRKDTDIEGGRSPLDSVQATKEEREAGILFALLSSALGKVDEPPPAGSKSVEVYQGHEKGKEKQIVSPANDALARALQRLLPYLPLHATQANVPAGSPMGTNAAGHPHTNADVQHEPAPQVAYSQSSYSRLFKTAEESFHSALERGPNRPYDQHRMTTNSTPSKDVVPKVREDAHPVPGGGWARGRNIVPRTTSSSQLGAVSLNGKTSSDDSGTPPSELTTIAAPDKENMPPAKSKRGLKRSLSSSVGVKENTTDIFSSKAGVKKRKHENMAKSPKYNATQRVMMGPVETNGATSGRQKTVPASSPVRSRTSPSPLRSLPISEPDYVLPRPSRTLPKSDKALDNLMGPLIASSTSHTSAIVSPRTPPRRPLDDAGDSLFTPSVPMSASGLDAILPRNNSLLSPPSPTLAKAPSHADNLPPSTSEQADDGQETTLAPRTGWDLPPSSPPPPTSPIFPDDDIATEENQMDWNLAMQLQSELSVEMEKTGTDGRFEDYGTTIDSAGGSTPAAGADDYGPSDHLSAPTSEFDVSPDDVFGLDELGQDGIQRVPDSNGIGLDIDELWSSLGPVIAHAQLDVGANAETDYGIYGLASDQSFEEQGAVDPMKLAEDLKSLFGGCVL